MREISGSQAVQNKLSRLVRPASLIKQILEGKLPYDQVCRSVRPDIIISSCKFPFSYRSTSLAGSLSLLKGSASQLNKLVLKDSPHI